MTRHQPHSEPRSRKQPNRSAAPLPAAAFPRSGFLREGYAAGQVDVFVKELHRAIRSQPPEMLPHEVADQRFKATRFGRGYSLRAVDDYLDRAEELLQERHGGDLPADGGRRPQPRPVRTAWIYLVGLLLVGLIAAYAVTQLLA